MATHSSILAWETPWTEGGWRTAVHGVAESSTQLIMHVYEAEKTTEERDNVLRAARKLMAGKACLWSTKGFGGKDRKG